MKSAKQVRTHCDWILWNKEHIEKVLKFAEGNKSKAARLLGISRKKLCQKIGEDS